MARTTLDLDDGVLRALQQRRAAEGRPMGAIASELLARALAEDDQQQTPGQAFTWVTEAMGAKVDLDDKDAVHRILDRP